MVDSLANWLKDEEEQKMRSKLYAMHKRLESEPRRRGDKEQLKALSTYYHAKTRR